MRAVADNERLSGSFQIGTARAAIMPPWLAGELVQALGAGTARAAIAKARTEDQRAQAGAYYDAFEGEAAYIAGDMQQAERLLAAATGALPEAEALLRARVLALLADLRYERGDLSTSLRDYERTLQIDPSVFRRLELRLPVRVQAPDNDVANRLVDALERSPRFDVGDRGLQIAIRADSAQGSVCLIGVSGAELACGRAEAKANDGADVLAGKLADDFHERAFAPHVDLTQVDANSLDGTNLRGSGQDLTPLLEGAGME